MEFCNLDTGKCFKEGNWIPLSEVGNKLETGDLVERPLRVHDKYPIIGGLSIPVIKHYGIYLEVDGKPMVAHNPFGSSPEIITLEQFENGIKIERIIRTGLSAEHIIKKTEECNKKYNLLFDNCEDYISYVCQCKRGFDQRVGWILFVVAIILIIIALRK